MTMAGLAPVNPYFFAGPIRQRDDFFGRKRELRSIFESIHKRECVNIVGERRSGKTSLLLNLLDRSVQEEHLRTEAPLTFVHVNGEICPQEPTGFFQEVFRQVKIQYPDLPFSSEEGAIGERQVRALMRTLAPRRMVLLVDEFEAISLCEHFPTRFFTFLRGLCMSYELSFIVATCKSLVECCSHEALTSPFPNIFKPTPIGPFAHEECDDFFRVTSQRCGAPLWDLRDEIVQLAGYLPYLVQMACYHYCEMWVEHGRLGEEERALARRRFETSVRHYFEYLWKQLSPEKQLALSLLLDGKRISQPHVWWELQQRSLVADGHIASAALADFIRQQTMPAAHDAPRVPIRGLYIDEKDNVFLDGEPITLTNLEFRLLHLLYENKGAVCSRDTIHDTVWSGETEISDEQRLDQLVRRLRAKLEPWGKPWRYILTTRGRGFTLGDGAPGC